MATLTGTTISHYDILESLGSGGMGTVYRARDTRLGRTVALKFLPAGLTGDPGARARLLHEARISSSLQHRNICVVHDVEETDDGQVFISMECLEGKTLVERIGEGPLSVREALAVITQVAEGIAAAHRSGIIHRDLKPANVMLAADGTPKILDFGLATTPGAAGPSAPGTVLGTAAYMSPEQAGGAAVDARTDVWSLGVMLFETLTGRRPFQSDYSQAVIYALMHERHPSARALRPEISGALERVIDRALEKSPAARFASAEEFLDALRGIDTRAAAPREPSARAIAVLPFADISQEKDNAYFSDGLTEEIIAKLSRLEHIRIVSRSSVMQYDRSGKSTRQIAGDLHVQYLLEGSVRKHGRGLRITTHLVDAERDITLWSSTYNGTMDQVFDIQEDVARRIVKALRVRLTPDDRRTLNRRATDNADAYQVYLKARFSWARRTEEGLRESIVRFEEAIARDPQFAPAWAGIADACILLTDFADNSRPALYARARAAVRCALAIDDRLAEAHTSQALIGMLNEWQWERAKSEFRVAIQASPNYVTAHHWYGELLSMLGDYDGAVAEFSRALELDPLSPAVHKDRGLIEYYGRQYDSAIRWARRTLELEPGFVLAHRILSLAYQAKGLFDEALREHHAWAAGNEHGPGETAALAQCLAAAGRPGDARALFDRFPPRNQAGGNLARGIALVHIALGETESAFDWLERAFEEKAESLGMLKVDPKVDAIRGDPRFGDLMARVGLPR